MEAPLSRGMSGPSTDIQLTNMLPQQRCCTDRFCPNHCRALNTPDEKLLRMYDYYPR